MGRPSKLTDRQWEDLLRKLASGEASATDLAKSYRISKTSISKRISQQAEVSKQLAKSLASVESQIDSLPVSQQRVIRTLADQMRQVSESLAQAAVHGADAANRLSGMAAREVQALEQEAQDGLPVTADRLRGVAALSATSNEASKIAMGLLAKQKEQVEERVGLEKMLSESWSQ